jgi:hypothetical protein
MSQVEGGLTTDLMARHPAVVADIRNTTLTKILNLRHEMPRSNTSQDRRLSLGPMMDFNSELCDFSNRCRLFPLPDVVLFPHALLPLHIFEPRYRQMTEDALASDRLVTMVQTRPGAKGAP